MRLSLPLFENATLFVVGDVMLDRYWYGNTDRISPEAPVPIVHVQANEEKPGGAGNVALNLAALGCQTTLFGLRGDDADGAILQAKLESARIKCHFNLHPASPTTLKLRILSQHQQLMRLDFEQALHEFDTKPLLDKFLELAPKARAVILSDYNKGLLKEAPAFIAAARAANIPVLVDPKGNDFSRYKGATLLTPNRKEFENIVGPCHSEEEICQKGLALIKELNIEALLITRGSQGMTLLQPNEPAFHLPAVSHDIYDVTGAGDTVIATLGASLATELNLQQATHLANIAAGISVTKLGAVAITYPELQREISKDAAIGRGIVNEEQLLAACAHARILGEKIIMTNGCFDILHAGHVAYLNAARQLGQRLIVAVNTDDSVKKLKGPQRPVNTLEQRMAVLAGLEAVDWVVPFSEDTPLRLISAVLPDILVKGGDYQPQDIPGFEPVTAAGGEVKVLNFVEGCSTTNIIKKLESALET